jgi:hypothetical protein
MSPYHSSECLQTACKLGYMSLIFGVAAIYLPPIMEKQYCRSVGDASVTLDPASE